ncbi:MAG: hypothetical protein KAT04_12485 [Methylococcales bacterium]|nr:hypothetical protein [Methylococcales bacterium]
MTTDIENQQKLSPKDFLKARRPERFSDSVRKEVGRLDRSVLEFQLSTLNKRNLELAFEDFAKKLCEKIICPNLLEQTGPVAGGDGKVDTQTFPVSEQTKILWFVGVNENANKERWAFAVSTQEDWKAKCRSDVRKIKATNRDYKQAFCVTNRYTKANQRSDLEDSLTKETGIDVRILDVSWIMDQIFSNGYEQLAIDTLSIDIDWRREIEVGSNDYTKTLRLHEVEKDINEHVNASEILPHQLDWLLETAILSKELEKPVAETKGLFDRAVVSSEKYGTSFHEFNAHYQYAWAAYWWFEDITLFREQLQFCFDLAKKIGHSGQWGEVISLLGLYSTHCRTSEDEDLTDYQSLASEASSVLLGLAKKDERPSNALMSKTYIELINLQGIESVDDANKIFSSLLVTVKEGEVLVGFSFNELCDLITELDSVFGDLDSYEHLLNYFTEQASQRDGETKGALLSLKRGARRLDSNEPYQAIKLIGKSLIGLYKEEVKKDLYVALNLLSECYRKVGLLWASRANLLLAASIVTDEFWKSGELQSVQVYIYIRLAKVELELGRLNYALSWWEFACIVDSNIESAILTEKELQNFDAFLSQCILNIDINKLKLFSKLPDLLDKYQLFSSRAMLLHALGHENILQQEYQLEIDQEHIEYLQLVRDMDIGVVIPDIINCDERYSSIYSSVMGCNITVSFPFRTPLVELAETLLSVIEGFFSTTMVDQVFVFESRLDIEITADDDDEIAISHEIDDSVTPLRIDVLCSSFTSDMLNVSGQGIIQKWLHNFVIEVFAHLVRPKELEKTIDTMLGDDRALERSVSFGACFIGLQNIMGNDAVTQIKSLLNNKGYKKYDLIRSKPWDGDFPKVKPKAKPLKGLRPGNGDPPTDLINTENLTHKDVQVQDLIKIRLWDRTVWRGTGFAIYPNGTIELIFLFEDENAALNIFSDLENELGNEDKNDRLKITIVKNINKHDLAHYRVCINENANFNTSKTVQVIARRNTMTPLSSKNLDMFLSEFKKRKSYLLSYAIVKDEKMIPISTKNRKTILKHHINVVDAWQVGPNDMEVMAIDKDDEPVIPEGINDAPIIEVLKRNFNK